MVMSGSLLITISELSVKQLLSKGDSQSLHKDDYFIRVSSNGRKAEFKLKLNTYTEMYI